MHEGKGATLRISPRFTVADWDALKPLQTDERWNAAVNIFRDRMDGRYLSILDHVQGFPNGGFVLVAMDCALVETLQQFRDGVTDRGVPSGILFKKCVKAAPFNLEAAVAGSFYRALRCGLLHKTQTDLGSRLSRSGDFVRFEDGQLVVNRDAFHLRVKEAYADYCNRLLDAQERVLRENFVKKMDYIAEKRGRAVTV